ncbi:F-box LRR-repeat related protein [Cyclospora cayetanensis]|uniref:F-box LRR-repeat related protein n=1 Tax=Cyclospora cayetanensis TaxID=88456 RepID=A0A1D3D1T7_9EIME|nr:F-box LRR-repeat related protein [Cyclospora cayetanensis]
MGGNSQRAGGDPPPSRSEDLRLRETQLEQEIQGASYWGEATSVCASNRGLLKEGSPMSPPKEPADRLHDRSHGGSSLSAESLSAAACSLLSGEGGERPTAAGDPTLGAVEAFPTEFVLAPSLLAVALSFLELPDLLRCLLVSRLFHEAACIALANVTAVGDTARVLLTDNQLRVLIKRTRLKSLEIDGFLLTPKGLHALREAPLEALALAGIEQKDDAFLEALHGTCERLRSFGFVCYGGEAFSIGALEALGRSLKNLRSVVIEARDERLTDTLAEASLLLLILGVLSPHAPLVRRLGNSCGLSFALSLTVGGITESCLLRTAQRVGPQLHTFSYTRLNVEGAPVSDALLHMCALRMRSLSTLRICDALSPRALQGIPRGLHQYTVCPAPTSQVQQQPLVSAEGLSRLQPLLALRSSSVRYWDPLGSSGQLKALTLSRSFGLPFAVLSNIDFMTLARSLSSNLEELELNGLHGVSDAFLHEALDACGSGTPEGDPLWLERPPRKKRRWALQPSPERLHSWRLKKVSLEASDISDVGLQTLATSLGTELVSLCLKGCHAISEGGHAAIAACCPNLIALNLGACSGVNDLSVGQLLNGCNSLRTLVLNDARITDLSLNAIGHCLGSSILELALHRNDRLTDEGLGALAAACPSLRRLSLSKCTHLGDPGIIAIAEGCRRLVSLRLDGTKTSDPGVQAVALHLRRLEFLHLSRCMFVSGAALYLFCIDRNPALKCIAMPCVKVTSAQAAAFREKNPNTLLKLEDCCE